MRKNCFCKPYFPGILLPGCPDFRAIAAGCLLSVADDGRFHKGRVIKDLVFLCPLVVHVLHQRHIGRFAVPVDEIVDPANGPQDTVEFLTGHSVLLQVDGLEFDPAFLEVSFGFLCIKAFCFAENLNINT